MGQIRARLVVRWRVMGTSYHDPDIDVVRSDILPCRGYWCEAICNTEKGARYERRTVGLVRWRLDDGARNVFMCCRTALRVALRYRDKHSSRLPAISRLLINHRRSHAHTCRPLSTCKTLSPRMQLHLPQIAFASHQLNGEPSCQSLVYRLGA
jgi:hypothetical protein